MDVKQEKAQKVWTWLDSKDDFNDIEKVSKSLPAMLQRNGLLQTLSYLQKKGNAHEAIYQFLRSPGCLAADFEKVLSSNFSQMRVFECEARAYLVWIKELSAVKKAVSAVVSAEEKVANE